MKCNKSRYTCASLFMLVLATGISTVGLSCRQQPSTTGETRFEKVSLRLSWIKEAHAAGYIVAIEKGFYRDEDLDVNIKEGGIDFSPVKLVAAGSDDFGSESGGETILLAQDKGIAVQAVAVIPSFFLCRTARLGS